MILQLILRIYLIRELAVFQPLLLIILSVIFQGFLKTFIKKLKKEENTLKLFVMRCGCLFQIKSELYCKL